jgi:hypothetical protein
MKRSRTGHKTKIEQANFLYINRLNVLSITEDPRPIFADKAREMRWDCNVLDCHLNGKSYLNTNSAGFSTFAPHRPDILHTFPVLQIRQTSAALIRMLNDSVVSLLDYIVYLPALSAKTFLTAFCSSTRKALMMRSLTQLQQADPP